MEIKDIKSQLRIEEVLAKYGLSIGKNKMIHCPFHDDKTPSMQVYPKTDSLYCFSSNCKTHGKKLDVIDFIMYIEARGGQPINKAEAIRIAKEMCGHVESTQKKETKKPAEAHGQLEIIFPELQKNLRNSKKAQGYLASRNLTYDVKDEIGYRNDRAQIKGMKECIIFPLKNCDGQTVSFYGRSVNGSTANSKGHYYSEGRSGLYPCYPNKETKKLILTESIIDAFTLQKHTNYAVLALYGTNGFTAEHLKSLQSCTKLEEIILFMDGDAAGQSGVSKYAKMLHDTLEVKVSQVLTPEGEDPNSLLDSHEPEILDHLIQERINLFPVERLESVAPTGNKEQKISSPRITNHLPLNTENPEYLIYQTDQLQISILGGISLHPIDKLKVTLKLERKNSKSAMHQMRQNLDLYHEDQLEKLARKAAERLELGSKEMLESLLQLTESLEDYRLAEIESRKEKRPEKRVLSSERRAKVEKFLSSKDLLLKTNDLIGKTGMVGEENNRLLMYLVFTSRLRRQPLHIVSLGASGTGKTYLQEKIAELIPEDQKLEITALSENALYYFDRKELKNKLVLIEDLDGANDDKVLFAIRELQSKKRISKTIPIKDAKGNLKTITLQVEGPITLAGTTTKEKLYEDNANRSLLIYLDNSKTHKGQIMDYQRKLSAGQIDRLKEEQVKEFFKDVQSVLEPIEVRNPYAPQLKIPESVFKPLRSNAHYLNFIEVVTFYSQYQRTKKQDSKTGQYFIETTLEDIAQANVLLKDVLLAKSDELTKASRDFFEMLKIWVEGNNKSSFYSKEVRTVFKMSPTTLNRNLRDLVRYGYVDIVAGTRARGFEYEITNRKEYDDLKKHVGNALDQAFGQLKIAS